MDTLALAEVVGRLLQQRGWSLGLAESCTGGMVAMYITEIPGSSNYFQGSIVAYSYEAKKSILGVTASTLEQHGAVSAETAMAMAEGARRLLRVDVAVAVTGIAGPSGATPDKPLGLTYIALSSSEGELWRKYLWKGNRRTNREQSARAALELLREHLETIAPIR